MIKLYSTAFFLLFIVASCKESTTAGAKGEWHYTKSYPLTNVYPVSITGDAAHLYITSGLKTEIHKMNYDGGLVEQIKNIRKPKYINALSTGVEVVAESEAHVASRVQGQEGITTIPTNQFLETPYGVSVEGNNIVISDFSKNTVYYNNGGKVMNFGGTGNGNDQLNGPSDIQFKNGIIYLADSKNNRVQVYDANAKYLKTIGNKDNIKTVGGIYVSDNEIGVTDYGGNRLLIYSDKGKLLQTFTENLEQPSDVFIRGREMFVVNYNANTIAVYSKW
ncbi:MAG: hypothetical protein ABI844_11615 [Saprospiraceae bacterium]